MLKLFIITIKGRSIRPAIRIRITINQNAIVLGLREGTKTGTTGNPDYCTQTKIMDTIKYIIYTIRNAFKKGRSVDFQATNVPIYILYKIQFHILY